MSQPSAVSHVDVAILSCSLAHSPERRLAVIGPATSVVASEIDDDDDDVTEQPKDHHLQQQKQRKPSEIRVGAKKRRLCRNAELASADDAEMPVAGAIARSKRAAYVLTSSASQTTLRRLLHCQLWTSDHLTLPLRRPPARLAQQHLLRSVLLLLNPEVCWQRRCEQSHRISLVFSVSKKPGFGDAAKLAALEAQNKALQEQLGLLLKQQQQQPSQTASSAASASSSAAAAAAATPAQSVLGTASQSGQIDSGKTAFRHSCTLGEAAFPVALCYSSRLMCWLAAVREPRRPLAAMSVNTRDNSVSSFAGSPSVKVCFSHPYGN